MKTSRILLAICLMIITSLQTHSAAAQTKQDPAIAEMRQQIKQLRSLVEQQRQSYERRLESMQRKLDALAGGRQAAKPSGEDELRAALADKKVPSPAEPKGTSLPAVLQNMNPQISVILDTVYYRYSHKEGLGHLMTEMAGFGHGGHAGHDHGHDHGLSQGFNLRHLELVFSAEVDPYFKGHASLAVSEDGAEVHEAYIDTSNLPGGFKLRVGRFFSNFSRINRQHTHEWDFVDAPLIYSLTLGDHGLVDNGLQLSWLAPLSTHLLVGLEALQGDNENMFNYIGAEGLPEKNGPRLWVGWIKLSPNLPQGHGLQIGTYFARGVHQEEHDGDGDGEHDHWLGGHSYFYGLDLVYKYDSGRAYGQGDWTIQADYFRRNKDLTVVDHALAPAVIGHDRTAAQDGYYIQGVYGFAPRWRTGLRWEQVGLTNKDTFPDGSSADYGSSWRMTGMIDFSPSHFSRIRLQTAYGSYAMSEGPDEEDWQVWLQLQISLGTHGAHKF